LTTDPDGLDGWVILKMIFTGFFFLLFSDVFVGPHLYLDLVLSVVQVSDFDRPVPLLLFPSVVSSLFLFARESVEPASDLVLYP
jgi:hypothetical protein